MKAIVQKILVFIFLLAGVFIIHQRINATSFGSLETLLYHTHTYYFLLATISLIPTNWLFDSLIWHELSFPFRGRKLWISVVENLQSQGLGWLTPASLGEYYTKGKEFSSLKGGLWMTLFYRWSKLYGKTTLALIGATFLPLSTELKLTFSFGILIMGVIFLFPEKSLGVLARIKRVKSILPRVDFPNKLNQVPWQGVFTSSMAKAFVFALQFGILSTLFSDVSLTTLVLYASVFFGLSGLVPTAGWADPVIKAGVGLLFFPPEILPSEGVIMVTTLLWILNVVLPTLPSLVKKGYSTLLG